MFGDLILIKKALLSMIKSHSLPSTSLPPITTYVHQWTSLCTPMDFSIFFLSPILPKLIKQLLSVCSWLKSHLHLNSIACCVHVCTCIFFIYSIRLCWVTTPNISGLPQWFLSHSHYILVVIGWYNSALYNFSFQDPEWKSTLI